jgi:hypothetical protein
VVEGALGDAVGAGDVTGGAGLELAAGVAELVEDFLDEFGGAGPALSGIEARWANVWHDGA